MHDILFLSISPKICAASIGTLQTIVRYFSKHTSYLWRVNSLNTWSWSCIYVMSCILLERKYVLSLFSWTGSSLPVGALPTIQLLDLPQLGQGALVQGCGGQVKYLEVLNWDLCWLAVWRIPMYAVFRTLWLQWDRWQEGTSSVLLPLWTRPKCRVDNWKFAHSSFKDRDILIPLSPSSSWIIASVWGIFSMSKNVRHGITCLIGLLTIQLKPLATPEAYERQACYSKRYSSRAICSNPCRLRA